MTTHAFRAAVVLMKRSLRHILRSTDTIVTTAVTPLLFVYVFGGAIDTGAGGAYIDYLLPGILLITVASGVAYTAFRLYTDVSGGIFERFQSMPIGRSAVLWAHVLTSLLANLVSPHSSCSSPWRRASAREPVCSRGSRWWGSWCCSSSD